MDMLKTAIVDITTLVACCHALKPDRAHDEIVLQQKLRKVLRRDLRCATVAYIDVLARSRQGMVDAVLLFACRMAAESQMPAALAEQESLARIMAVEDGALDGLVAARLDLWRLAHVAISLGHGMAALRQAEALVDVRSADALAERLRRRCRKALIAYARASMRTKTAAGRLIVKARKAAVAEIGARGAAEAERLADLEADADPALSTIRQGVTRTLLDLALDWRPGAPAPR
jgi:hypothetical protein